jgi:hypothetical protein
VLLYLSDPETGPLLTGGAVSSPVMQAPEIKAAEPGRFTKQRRARFAAQMANLAATGRLPHLRSEVPHSWCGTFPISAGTG